MILVLMAMSLMLGNVNGQRIVVKPNYLFGQVCCRNNNLYQIPNYAYNMPVPRMPILPNPVLIASVKPERKSVQGDTNERAYPRSYPYSRAFFNRNLKRGAPIITTALGSISGRLITTSKGFRMLAYLGIPYAERPVRFDRANPRRSFGRGILDASEYGPSCPMASLGPSGVVTLKQNSSEDCLFLKILSPEDRTTPRPVLFWIHGGGFVAGSNQDGDLDALGDNILSKGVIIAQPNYRLGPFGFWSSMTRDAMGNYALWDVLTALQFIHREISAFGGDPHRIYLMGQGSGAILAEALSLSPLARGLFSGLIQLSGTAFDPRVNLPERVEEDKYKRFVAAAGCDDSESSRWDHDVRRRNVVLCLRQKNVLQLLQAQSDAKLMNSLDWHPRVDDRGGILPQSFEKLARIRPAYPVMMGSAKDETAWDMIVSPLLHEFHTRSLVDHVRPMLTLPHNIFNMNSPAEVRRQCDLVISDALFLNAELVRDACHAVFVDKVMQDQANEPFPPLSLLGRAFRQNKTKNNPYFWLKQAIAVSTSFFYHAPLIKSLGYHLANGNTNAHLYSLDYERVQDGQWWEVVGAFHNLDMALLHHYFPSDLYRFKMDDRDKYIRDVLIDSIANFVKTGTPSIPNGDLWTPVKLGSHDYYSVSAPATMKNDFHHKFVAFWNEFVPSLPRTTKIYNHSTTTTTTTSPSTQRTTTEYISSSRRPTMPHSLFVSRPTGLIPNPYFPYRPPYGPIPMRNILPRAPMPTVRITQRPTLTNRPTSLSTTKSTTRITSTSTKSPTSTTISYAPLAIPRNNFSNPDLLSTSLQWIKNLLPPILSSLRGENDQDIDSSHYIRRGMVKYNDAIL